MFFAIAGALVLLALFIFAFRRLLDVAKPVDAGERPSVASALKSRWAVFGAAAIFLYVGAEVSIGSAMTNFLPEPDMLNIPLEEAGKMVSFYWGGAMVGRFIGSGLLFLVKQRAPWLLAVFALGAATLCLAVSQLHGATAAYLALSIGLFNSIMFPVIFTMTLERSSASPAATSGLLCLAIVGGAILPYVYGVIADAAGLHTAYFLPAPAYLLIVAVRDRRDAVRRCTNTAPPRPARVTDTGRHMDDRSRIHALHNRLCGWLLDAAYPLWSTKGVDPAGGFHERLGAGREAARGARAARASRRGRRIASRWGRRSAGAAMPRRSSSTASEFWYEKFQRPDGLFRTLINADGSVADDRAVTYDQAFGLLAFNLGATLGDWRAVRERQARELLQAVLTHTKRPTGGFENGVPTSLPLESNPHMHLFEATLAGCEVSSEANLWKPLADEIGGVRAGAFLRSTTACCTNSSTRTGSSRRACRGASSSPAISTNGPGCCCAGPATNIRRRARPRSSSSTSPRRIACATGSRCSRCSTISRRTTPARGCGRRPSGSRPRRSPRG